MNTRKLAATVAAVLGLGAALPALATERVLVRPLTLAESVALVARTYPGRVVAAQADATGGDRFHHHVDLMLPNGRVAKFDVDPRTQRIANRLSPEEAPAELLPLADAMKKVQAQTAGRVLAAEYDPDPQPHYHFTVRGRRGEVTRLDFDPATGQSAPHVPRS
jgi:uncharacterized membrane protein YkoI